MEKEQKNNPLSGMTVSQNKMLNKNIYNLNFNPKRGLWQWIMSTLSGTSKTSRMLMSCYDSSTGYPIPATKMKK